MFSVPSLASKRPGTSKRHTPVIFYSLKRLTWFMESGSPLETIHLLGGRRPSHRLPDKSGRVMHTVTTTAYAINLSRCQSREPGVWAGPGLPLVVSSLGLNLSVEPRVESLRDGSGKWRFLESQSRPRFQLLES